MRNANYIQTNRMITEVLNKYGDDSTEVTLMRLKVLSYKTGGRVTYEDCKKLYEKLMKKSIDKY